MSAPLRLAVWALASHWRRKPLLLIAALTGLMLATALWSGVQALNSEARASYAAAAATLGGAETAALTRADGAALDVAAFAALRAEGWPVSPVLEGRVRLSGPGGARWVTLLGVEPLSLAETGSGAAPLAAATAGQAEADGQTGAQNDAPGAGPDLAFLLPPYQAHAAPNLLRDLGLSPGAQARVAALGGSGGAEERASQSPPFAENAAVAPGVVIVDIAAAERLLGAPGRVTRLIIARDALAARGGPPAPRAGLPMLQEEASAVGADLERLTRSFHLNLTAFALLAFLVGLFIVNAAAGLAFEQRRGVLRTLRALGVSARTAAAAMVLELLVLTLAAAVAGVLLGYLIAASLMPGVAASLRGLYGAEVSGELSLAPGWWLSSIAMALAGALAAAGESLLKAYRMPILAAARAESWRGAQRAWLRGRAIVGLAALLSAPLWALYGGALGLYGGFALMGSLLLGGALVAPYLLDAALALGARLARRRTGASPVAEWFWADGRQQMGALSLALMALLLALSANIGVGAMVGGFRETFTQWLDQRLAAQVYYLAAGPEEAARVDALLQEQSTVAAVLPRARVALDIEGWPSALVGFVDHPKNQAAWPLLSQAPAEALWPAVAEGGSGLMSEQLARRLELWTGDTITLQSPAGPWTLRIAGVYPDYGNPKGELSVDLAALEARWPDAQRLDHGVFAAPEAAKDLAGLIVSEGGVAPDRVIDQAALKAYSLGIFERTFLVTGALNVLTLGVAATALLMALLTLSESRRADLAPLWALGVPRRALLRLEAARTLALALLVALLAVPLGVAVAAALVGVVNVQAFGWRLPLHHFPSEWLRLAALSAVAALLAAAPGLWRLHRTPPAALLKTFEQERR